MKALLAALLLCFAVPALAAGSLFTTVDPQSELRNPVSVGASLEADHLRLGASLGTQQRASGSFDLIGRTRAGLTLGVGVVVDRLMGEDYSSVTVQTDTTVTSGRHDQGKHKGDRHNHDRRTFTTTHSYMSVVALPGVDLGLSSSLFLGVSNPRGLFAESRVLFNGGDVSNRVSIGLRW